jgi:hypothetical protein
MLRFQSPPDAVFAAILHDALKIVQEEFEEEYLNDEDKKDYWKNQYSNAARVFSAPTARTVVAQLIEASSQPDLYQLTDYHWLLLYDVLQVYTDIHNDFLRDEGGLFPVGPYLVGEIDFSFIVDVYFWDTDFLMNGKIVADLGIEGREFLQMNKETFGLTQGLAPHPDELQLVRWDEPMEVSNEPVPPDGSIIRHYPDRDGEQRVVFEPGPKKATPKRPYWDGERWVDFKPAPKKAKSKRPPKSKSTKTRNQPGGRQSAKCSKS